MSEGNDPSRFATFWETLRGWADAERLRQHEDQVILVLTLIIGALVGLLVVAFILLTENLGARMYPAGGAAWRRVVIPVLGALITGFLLQRYFPNARGSGIPQTKTALFLHGGVIRFRTVLGKFGCSSVSLASGIALGREGPSVQVGAGIASSLGRQLGLSPARIKSLVPIGSAAALAAAFNTPIAAVLFTLEEVMGDLHAPVLGSIVLSSATSWMVLQLLLGGEPLFHVPAYQLVHPLEFACYAVLGVVGGLVSVCFVKLLLWLRQHFQRMPVRTQWIQPAAGGLVVGLLGWFVPDVLGVGYNHVSQALNGQLALGVMALLVVLKLVATASCYASGNAGGIFGPSLFIGAMMGGAIGGWAHILLPDYTGSVGAYALVGMGAAFAGIIRVPLTSVIMIFEVTRDYSIIVPLMIANLISYFISSRLQQEPIYEALLHQDGIHLPAGARDREELRVVGQGMRRPAGVLRAADQVEHVVATVDRRPGAWPVADENGLLGMVTTAQLEEALKEGRGHANLGELLPPPDSRVRPTAGSFPHVHADQPLDTAIRRLAQTGLRVLPVVSRANLRELEGTISYEDALAALRADQDESRIAKSPQQETKRPLALLGGVLTVLIAMLVVAGLLSHFYRQERSARAQQYFQEGDKLMAKDRYQEAVEQYRDALSISHSSEHRLALALALVKAGSLNEAEIYLREVTRSHPNSGPGNLGLGRVAVQRGDIQQAVSYYHRAIYGSWPAQRERNRVQARIELVEALGKAGQMKQARAELLALVAEMPDEVAVRKQVGRLLLGFGLPKESAEVFREILQKDRQDAEAYAGLGEAEFSLDRYHSAQDAFKHALRRNPADETSGKRLQLTEQILALDPALRGLGAAERYRRSQKLIEAALGEMDQCLAARKQPPPPAVNQLLDTARKTLLNRSRPSSYSDAAEDNIALAEQLWETHGKLCGPPGPAGEALSRIMARLASK
jgi:CIC family chloride channel protein